MVALFCFVLALFALPFKSKSRLEAEKSGLRFKDELAKLASKMQRLKAIEEATLASPDLQISLTDPDLRPMATSGRGSGVVGYNAQVAVDTEYHLIVTHEVTNTGSDRSQLGNIASQTKGGRSWC